MRELEKDETERRVTDAIIEALKDAGGEFDEYRVEGVARAAIDAMWPRTPKEAWKLAMEAARKLRGI